jgi:phosphoglycolate phosphatase-like HAD superfamily hydrolase
VLPSSNIIAIICDFDDTLGDDTTELFMKAILGMSGQEIDCFWNEDVKKLVRKGWDPPLACIDRILRMLKKNKLETTNNDLRELGKKARLFPGVPDLFQRLNFLVNSRKEFQEAFVRIEFYIISGGFEEIIQGTSIANEMKDIFGCTFQERKGQLVPKSTVTFTEKTRFLYAINKGISGQELRRNPYRVNDVIPENERRIAFKNMIYVGDGPTDIPCFSTVQKNGGKTVGILKHISKGREVIVDKRRAWAIARGERATLGPFQPDYRENSDLYVNLVLQIERVGLDISDAFKRKS